MGTIGLWHINDSGPARLQPAELAAERHLEDWIERDPALLERGLVIVGRQIRLEGGPLDLLALDPQGRWVLIEIKREQLRREVVCQAIDYASCLDRLDPAWLRQQCDTYLRATGVADTLDRLLRQRGRELEEGADGRDVVIYLVGTGIDSGLERMVSFLAGRADLAVRLVTFSVFRDAQGNTLMAREIHEGDDDSAAAPHRASAPAPAADTVLGLADRNGVGDVARTLYGVASELGLHVRPWKTSLMFAPPSAKTRCLFTVWTEARPKEPGLTKVYVAPEAFEQFYGVKETELAAASGLAPVGGWHTLDQARADRFAAGLRKVLEHRL